MVACIYIFIFVHRILLIHWNHNKTEGEESATTQNFKPFRNTFKQDDHLTFSVSCEWYFTDIQLIQSAVTLDFILYFLNCVLKHL